MPVPRNQLTATVLDDGERPKPVVLQFKYPLGMVEGQRFARQRHWLVCHRLHDNKTPGEDWAKLDSSEAENFNLADQHICRLAPAFLGCSDAWRFQAVDLVVG